MMSKEMKTTVMEIGLELYNQAEIKKLKPSFYELVKVLDGRISRNIISIALDILEDIGLVKRSAETGYQHSLSSEGIVFFESIYKKVVRTT